MNYVVMVAYVVAMVMSPAVPFLVYSLVKEIALRVKALRVLSREQRTGESLYDTAEALAGDAHNWRGMTDDAVCIGDSQDRARSANLVAPQHPPQNSDGPALWPLIISELGDSETDRLVAIDMQSRHEFGVAKYGVPLVASNGRDHLADAYQEVLDCVVYLRAAHEWIETSPEWNPGDRDLWRALGQLYIDMLDAAKEIRGLIRQRDGK